MGKVILHEDVNIITSDSPSQAPSPQTIVDVAIAGLSCSSLYAENIGEYPQRPRGQPERDNNV
jgi:hypothetical protein